MNEKKLILKRVGASTRYSDDAGNVLDLPGYEEEGLPDKLVVRIRPERSAGGGPVHLGSHPDYDHRLRLI